MSKIKVSSVVFDGLLRPKPFIQLSVKAGDLELCRYVLACAPLLRLRLFIAKLGLKAVARKVSKFEERLG